MKYFNYYTNKYKILFFLKYARHWGLNCIELTKFKNTLK